MSRAAWIAWAALAVLPAGARQDPPETPAPSAPRVPESAAQRLDRWSEWLELDLAAEVLAEARPLLAPGGALVTDARAVGLLARAWTSAGRLDEARALIERCATAQPPELATLAHARLALEEDDLDGVIELLWDGAAQRLRMPELAEAHLLAGRARVRLGQWTEARPLLERFVEASPLSPEAPAAWHMLAQEALRRRDTARARECAEREEALGRWHAYHRARRLQIRERPSEPLPRLGLAQLWLEVGEFARARAALDELLAIAPDFARGWMALGETQRKQADLDGARASYDRALELDPGLDIARFNRAGIARMQGRDADARADLERLLGGAAGIDARFASGHLDLARLLAKAGLQERATAAYARYRELGGKEPL